MSEDETTRRKLLAALAAAGSGGAVAGSGTAALLSDEETLFGNEFAAGVVNLRVTPSGVSVGRGEQTTLTVTLSDGRRANAAYVWLRARCPTGDTGRADEIDVELRYDGGAVVAEGTLLDVANTLRNGVVLSPRGTAGVQPGEQDCLTPGESIRLVLDVTGDTEGGDVTLDVDVTVRQCRNRDGTVDPFPSVAACDSPGSDRTAISFLAFCSETAGEPTADDITDITVVETKDGGEPLAVTWDSAVPIDTVVIKRGGGPDALENVAYDDATSGRAEVGEGSAAAGGQSPSDPCPSGQSGVKFEYDGGTFQSE